MAKLPHALHLGQIAVPGMEKKQSHEQTKHNLEEVVSQSHETICEATCVFPFDLFPDTIIIDRTKITIINRLFFFVANHITINLEDVLNVTSTVGPFFGSLQIHTRFFDPHKPYAVNFLWRWDAKRIDRILQGYHIAVSKKLDLKELDAKELAVMLDDLGRGYSRN